MPQTSPKTSGDRALAQNVDVHPRPNGDLILLPDDILEGQGYFTAVDADGNPEGFRLGSVEVRDGWHVYDGDDPEKTTRQTTSALPVERPSFLFSQPSVRGHAPPTRQVAARVAPPLAPHVRKTSADRVGYSASTEESPYWYAYSLAQRLSNGRFVHTLLSPFAVCEPNANGQGFRVPLPPPELAAFCGLWLTEPGTSTADRAGKARLQREVRVRDFSSGFYELSGPYRYDGRLAPTRNESALGRAGRAYFRFESTNTACRIGILRCAASLASTSGEGPAGDMSDPLEIEASSYYGDDNPAGYGKFRIYRPKTSQQVATGWYAYVETGGNVYRVYQKTTGLGLTKPLPLSWSYIETAGWEGGEYWAENDIHLLTNASLPTSESNESGIENPDSAPASPTAFGAELPEPGVRYVRVTDTYRGKESLPSPPVRVDLGAGEVMRVVYRSPVNGIPNATYIETDPDNLPFDHEITAPAGAARVDSGALVLEVLPGQQSATYEEKTSAVPVNVAKPLSVGSEFIIEPPVAGQAGGTVESVLIEENAAGSVIAQTVLYSALGEAFGEHEFYATTAGPGSARPGIAIPQISLNPQTFATRLVHRILQSVGIKNTKLRIKRKQIKDHVQRPRPTKPVPLGPPGKPVVKPDPDAPLPPGGETVTTPPPPPPVPPAPPVATVYAISEPDRPRSSGTVLLDLEGFLGGIPSGWQTDRSPADSTTSVQTSSAAAISGSLGLLLRDTGTQQNARANISKVVDPDGRHDLGIYAKNRMADMPISGSVRMHPLTALGGNDIAWLELGTEAERSKLTIGGPPKAPGSVDLYVDGVKTSVAVQAVREVARLDINGAPLSSGTVSVILDGLPTNIQTGGTKQVVSLVVQRPRYNGRVKITLGGVNYTVRVNESDSPREVAEKIRRTPVSGWQISGSNNQIVFTARQPGTKGACAYDRHTSVTPGNMTVTQAGANESATELAARIRATRFLGWTTGGTGTQVTFTAVIAGARRDPEFSAGSTGVVGAVTVTTQGSADSPSALAARIRALTFTGWTVGGSGAEVTFEATTQGFRRDLAFAAGPTQVIATTETTTQGKDADLFVAVRDSSGAVTRRKVMSALSESNVFETDLSVSGSGTDEAIVSLWGSIDPDPDVGTMELIARFENIDLTGSPASKAALGVTFESRPNTVFELHVDDALVTDRGRTYHRDHDLRGQLINQAHGYFVPNQPVRDDLFLQGPEGEEDGKRIGVLPGREYAFGAFARCRGVARQAKPLHLYAVLSDGTLKDLGCVTGGIVGTGGWNEYVRQVDVPENCSEIRLKSTGIGEGEFVVQELVPSLGTEPLRTDLYATSGSHTATLRVGPEKISPDVYAGRLRRFIGVDVDTPEETASESVYRSRKVGGAWSDYTDQHDDVPDGEIVEAYVSFTGDGITTPVLRSGFPLLEYDVVLGRVPLITFLKGDRSELPGGATFADVERWANLTKVGVRELPSGRLQKRALFDPVGRIPGSTLQVFTAEAKAYVEERWGFEPFAIEARDWGEVVWIELAAQPEFKRIGREIDGYGLWQATIVACEVTERRPLL